MTASHVKIEVLPSSDDENDNTAPSTDAKDAAPSTREPTPLELADLAKEEGNNAFRAGHLEEAFEHYSNALAILCDEDTPAARTACAIYHSNRATVSLKMSNAQSAVEDCTTAIELNPDYRKAYLKRAHAYVELPDRPHYDEALTDLRHLASLSPPDMEAKRMLPEFEKKAEAERERLKTEMVGQLKDLGNTFLGWFGLSTDNFNAQQDPSTGQYSLQFVQNAQKNASQPQPPSQPAASASGPPGGSWPGGGVPGARGGVGCGGPASGVAAAAGTGFESPSDDDGDDGEDYDEDYDDDDDAGAYYDADPSAAGDGGDGGFIGRHGRG
eukprot:TRINITY_DN34308_c0_g1_i1.p1 TRINITY_DN34308_c0_g1~~TRINITY_DN34308_c0_g1_i1.p1  ORF type:complete len:327 (+),score=39.86 TRINITY_DN34308_c0_g1_i1:140-1120(+)